jgi:ATP-dependent DNA ligase
VIGVKAPLPAFRAGQATSDEKVPSGSRWIYEIKFDGYRVQVHLANEAVKIFTRRSHDTSLQEGRARLLAHQGESGVVAARQLHELKERYSDTLKLHDVKADVSCAEGSGLAKKRL